jgi:hypothetical protein
MTRLCAQPVMAQLVVREGSSDPPLLANAIFVGR